MPGWMLIRTWCLSALDTEHFFLANTVTLCRLDNAQQMVHIVQPPQELVYRNHLPFLVWTVARLVDAGGLLE